MPAVVVDWPILRLVSASLIQLRTENASSLMAMFRIAHGGDYPINPFFGQAAEKRRFRSDVALGVRLMILRDLLAWPERRSLAALPEMDALVEPDALLEAAVLDVSLDATTSSICLLFDCRGAVHLQVGNTAVIVVRGVTGHRWQADVRSGHTWRAVMGSQPEMSQAGFSLIVRMTPNAFLHVTGRDAEFYVGNVSGGDDPPPDFTSASDSEIRSGLASWASDFDPVHASFR